MARIRVYRWKRRSRLMDKIPFPRKVVIVPVRKVQNSGCKSSDGVAGGLPFPSIVFVEVGHVMMPLKVNLSTGCSRLVFYVTIGCDIGCLVGCGCHQGGERENNMINYFLAIAVADFGVHTRFTSFRIGCVCGKCDDCRRSFSQRRIVVFREKEIHLPLCFWSSEIVGPSDRQGRWV